MSHTPDAPQRAPRARLRRSLTGVAAGAGVLALALACEPGILTAPTVASSVRLSPRGQSIEVGDSTRITAAALDRSGTILIASRRIEWVSETPALARVDSTGYVVGKLPGTARLRATVDGFSDTISVTILAPSVQAVRFSPDTATLIVGTTRQLVANAYGRRDTLLTGRTMTWGSSAPGVATVSSTGLVTAAGLGTALITAEAEGKVDTASVTIVPVPVKRLVVTPNPVAIQLGSTLQLAADPQDSTGASLSGRTVTWSSNASGIAAVNATTGLLTAVANGSTSVVATSEGIVTTVPVTVAAPSIALSSTTVTFTDRATGSNPAAQVLNVTNGGQFTLSGLSRTVTYGSGQPTGWLAATLSATTAPATLTLQATTGSLAPGTYTATVQVASTQTGVAAQNVNVTFTVTPQPQIGLSATAPVFGALTSGPDPAAQVVNVTNSGTGTLSNLSIQTAYGAGQPTGWLEATLGAATAPTTITLQPRTGSLATGSYTATVTVSSTQAFVTARTINVTFNVVAGPAIGLSTSAVGLSRVAFATVTTGTTVNVTNIGNGTLDGLSQSITYAGGQPTGWLVASLAGTTAPTTLSLTASASALAAGTYNATVSVASTVPGATTQDVAVTLTVTPQPAIGVAPTSASWTITRGSTAPGTAIAVTNTGGTGASLSGLSISNISYGAGATGWLSGSNLAGTTAPTTLNVVPGAGVSSLAAGTYTATLTLSSTVPGVADVNVPASLTVQQPVLSLSTSSIAKGSITRGLSTTNNAVTVSNTGDGTLGGLSVGVSYTTGGTSWITASLNTTTAPATLTLSYNTANLAVGSNAATVTVSSTVPGVASQQVTVTATGLQPQIGLGSVSWTTSAPSIIGDSRSATVSVTNSGTGTLGGLSVGFFAAPTWLSSATLSSSSAPTTLNISVNTSAITNAGTYSVNIPIQSSQTGVTQQTVTVQITVGWSYTTHIAPLLAGCNGCHTYTMSRANLVNVAPNMSPCSATASNRRVLPGNAASSVLYSKVSTLTPFCGVAMPQGTSTTWNTEDLKRLREWINSGALDN